MRLIFKTIIIILCAEGIVGAQTDVNTRQGADSVNQLLSRTGKEYREFVTNLTDIPLIEKALRENVLSDQSQLLAKVIEERSAHSSVFREYADYLKSLRQQLESSKTIGVRSGYLSGMFLVFARKGPESATVEKHKGWTETPKGMIQETEQVVKYTEDEIRVGKARNKAARMAILEHFLKFAGEGSEYEQNEIVLSIAELWGRNVEKWRDDGITAEVLLQKLSQDTNRVLSVRVAAMNQLPPEQKTGEREFMLQVLTSSSTDGEAEHGRIVREAIAFLKAKVPTTLRDIKCGAFWKQILVSEATGLPRPEVPK